ncbi:hypothetical protein [Comamonas sp. 26]|uniref:hypothetical protein n=1 Tax=Comamonas sp. 26 TaxID=2035201 RepID=UPI000C3AE6B9|nr:hypothetical protein [Comamonas sp. 26]PIG09494.1 hypothetical protein CLU84_2405 [Comamonas sp. 26]
MKATVNKNFNARTRKAGHPDVDSHSVSHDDYSHTPDHPIQKGRFILSDLVTNNIPSPKASQVGMKIVGKKFLSE